MKPAPGRYVNEGPYRTNAYDGEQDIFSKFIGALREPDHENWQFRKDKGEAWLYLVYDRKERVKMRQTMEEDKKETAMWIWYGGKNDGDWHFKVNATEEQAQMINDLYNNIVERKQDYGMTTIIDALKRQS